MDRLALLNTSSYIHIAWLQLTSLVARIFLFQIPWKLVTGKLSFTITQFTNSPTREQSNKRSGTRLKTESETGERRFEARALCGQHLSALRKTLTPRFTDIFTDFEKKTRLF